MTAWVGRTRGVADRPVQPWHAWHPHKEEQLGCTLATSHPAFAGLSSFSVTDRPDLFPHDARLMAVNQPYPLSFRCPVAGMELDKCCREAERAG